MVRQSTIYKYFVVEKKTNREVIMREIMHHLLGSCGEHHFSLLTILSSGFVVLYKDYILCIIREARDVLFK